MDKYKIDSVNFDYIKNDEYWNFGDFKEDKMHSIHAYPAKFPAFIATKAISYARKKGVNVNRVGDIFCGCGTVAYESAKEGIHFWGCDINPVAALIARVKSKKLDNRILEKKFVEIKKQYHSLIYNRAESYINPRIVYWFEEQNIIELQKILLSINKVCGFNLDYKNFFLCAFSNILKSTSRWLTKSIKPTVDRNKTVKSPFKQFEIQFNKMAVANYESLIKRDIEIDILTQNSLNLNNKNKLDLLITSPPYVTSYEYADLHQLSILWLNFSDDYREFRKNTIGSLYKNELEGNTPLNKIGEMVLEELICSKFQNSRTMAIRKYYEDMQLITMKSYELLNKGGIALFVIGNTEYNGIRIRNAEHLALSMSENGFVDIEITKRKISNKILTPYRDTNGRFTKVDSGKKIYSEEFIITGRKS
ncbi:class I SAM-dependent methyltransferase [Bacillus altitudinis]|uniref:class I SAM-dependent methyltransferase n=1 Tax=Bacillus altitudinis TaxID=293387 RepID=UPI0022804C14|nr:class I SAM-dependent methyltransferase [Bacillus altitudinis]MCY7690159.1 class I SAM-dependent methyltransferase [Bacillus altitudinis]